MGVISVSGHIDYDFYLKGTLGDNCSTPHMHTQVWV